MASNTPTTTLPLHTEAGLLLIGGTAANVALALAARRAGHSVFLTCARPYLGEDICGDMLLWPDAQPQGQLARAVFPDFPGPSTPMHIKLTLEQALAGAGVPFLLNTHVVDVLPADAAGAQAAVFATRSGLLAIRAAQIIRAAPEPRPRGRQTVLHTTLCSGAGADADGVEIACRPAGFSGTVAGDPYALSARTYRLVVDFGDGGPRALARAEAEIAGRCWVPGEYLHQERIRLEPAPGAPGVVAAMDAAEREAARIEPRRCPPAASPLVAFDADSLGRLESCDVLVVGGGTGGAPAAIAAGRAGADTIVIESTDLLGGVGTSGQITRYWFGNKCGFTSEIDAEVKKLETDETILRRDGEWSRSAKAEWYRRQCQGNGVTVLFRSLCAGARVSGGRVTALLAATPYGCGWITARCTVDATGCADVAAAAGAPVRTIGAGHVAVQGTGLAGLKPGRDYHNSDHNFCDDTSVTDTTAFLVSSKLKFRDHFDAGQLVDSRERRQIIGDIELGPVDFLAERRYPDTICVASSNFDTHGFTVHPVFLCKPMDKRRHYADVPFRALLAQGLERVLTTGLGLSAHRDALPVIRMQPDVQNHGYAAGRAAAMAARLDCDLRKLPLRDLQRHLVDIGLLPERALSDTDTFPVADAAIADAVANDWDSHKGLALIFADPRRSVPMVEAELARCSNAEQRLRYSLILGILGVPAGAPVLMERLDGQPWDAGWNYRGMGQFGMSLSETDACLIALGRCGDASAWPLILEKIEQLPEPPEFSHCRAVAEACEGLYPRHPDKAAAAALAAVLRRPGMTSHHQADLASVQAQLTLDPEENAVRNRALRELHLARALYRCGDANGLGRSILEAYAGDLRAHFARHARAVLAE